MGCDTGLYVSLQDFFSATFSILTAIAFSDLWKITQLKLKLLQGFRLIKESMFV